MENTVTKKKLIKKRKADDEATETKIAKKSLKKKVVETSEEDVPAKKVKKAKKVAEVVKEVEEEDEEEEEEVEEKAKSSEESTVPDHASDEKILEQDFDPNGDDIDYSFDSLNINENTRKAIDEMGFTRMTEVQARTIPVLLVRPIMAISLTYMLKSPYLVTLMTSSFFHLCRRAVMSLVLPRPAPVKPLHS